MGKEKGKKPSRRVRKGPVADEPAALSAVVDPAAAPTRKEPPAELGKGPATEQAPQLTAPTTVMVSFVLVEPEAKQVSLCGDFNGWSREATPMRRGDSVRWEVSVALAPGSHQYKFVVDGQWIPDPSAKEHVWNRHGTLNSVVEVHG